MNSKSGPEPQPRGRTVLMALSPVALGLLLVALGWGLAHRLAGPVGGRSLLAGVGLVLVAVYATMLPALRQMRRAATADRLKIGLRAGLRRFLVVLVAAAAIGWKAADPAIGLDRRVFLACVGMSYAVLVVVEAVVLAMATRTGKAICP